MKNNINSAECYVWLVESLCNPIYNVKKDNIGEKSMLSENLQTLRKLNQMTQEEVAEKIGVSRQALAKWENGETIPDIERCMQLADLYQVSLDALTGFSEKQSPAQLPPKGKHVFGVVKVGDKGQIVIPGKARKVFDIQPGDHLVVLGDEAQGIALIKEKGLLDMMREIRKLGSPTNEDSES